MKVNHEKIRNAIKLVALISFIFSILWRFIKIMKDGGTAINNIDDDDDEDKDEDDNEKYPEEPLILGADVIDD